MRNTLAGLNPLAKLGAIIIPAIGLVFVSDLFTPAAFLVLSYLVVLLGSRPTRTLAIVLFAVVPALIAVGGLSFSLWTSAARSGDVSVWYIGYATSLRLAAILAVSLIAGVGTTGPDLVRSCVQHLRMPYRIGYAALAAFRFVPRFKQELDVIRSAHRVRGRDRDTGPFAAISRWWGYILPLMAGAIRHAERVALAMDSRAFGAYPTRTERHLVPWRRRDTAFMICFIVVSAALFVVPLVLHF